MVEEIETYDPDASNNNHEDAEAEEDTNAELLTRPDFHMPKDAHRDTNDCQKSAMVCLSS